ncbi:hypothetical protein BT96DRAFT_976081 [Gymnopus androsaceus JB14]|uniref:Glycosyltransferase family 32 protein n=1 Tax=Gymnopus androsaceus JB14 TaxID=1447944 RepID=A0A6A4HM59_9AGAR|nr:hypothetical protein BT96DRAFT_976081 [Gymnopus androsaceus JB14]
MDIRDRLVDLEIHLKGDLGGRSKSMSYDRSTIPLYNDPSDPSSPNHKSTFPSASSFAPAPITLQGHRHRKKSSAAQELGLSNPGYTRPNIRAYSPVRPTRWSIPIPVPRIVRKVYNGTFHFIRKTATATANNTVHSNLNTRRIRATAKFKKSQPTSLPKIIFITLLLGFCTLLYVLLVRIYELHIEIALFSRKFVREEVQPVKPLAGCFNRPSGDYNVTERLYGPKMTDLHAGLQMRFGLDCYEFAGTVKMTLSRLDPGKNTCSNPFFATQNLATSRLILWSNGDLRANPILKGYLEKYGQGDDWAFNVRVVDVAVLARGTELDPELTNRKHTTAWVDGDLIRLLLLWNYGGVWVDMDFLLTRDLGVLLEHEFVTQWDCYDKKYTPLNGALMHFFTHSPYLCEAFHIMATDPPPRPHSTDWGSTLYLKLWRRLVKGGVRPFKILPWCFTDGRSCRLDNRLPDPFKEDVKAGIRWWEAQSDEDEGGWWSRSSDPSYIGSPPPLSRALSQIFGVHLHNQWEKSFPEGGWVERLLLKTYERVLEGREARVFRGHGFKGLGGREEKHE